MGFVGFWKGITIVLSWWDWQGELVGNHYSGGGRRWDLLHHDDGSLAGPLCLEHGVFCHPELCHWTFGNKYDSPMRQIERVRPDKESECPKSVHLAVLML